MNLFPEISDEIVETVSREAMLNVISSRDRIGVALSYAISDRDFVVEDSEISYDEIHDEELIAKVKVLVRLLGVNVDTEIITVAFNVSYEQASRVLSRVAKLIEDKT